jgi:ankyrin repeat protein
MKKTIHMITALLVLAFSASAEEQPKPIKSIPQEEIIEAALGGNLAVVEKALAQGYKPDTPDREGRTILMYAAFNGQTNVAGRLIAAGANVNAQDQSGSTALMFAASGPFASTVQLLLAHGAKINTVDNNEHWSALMWAAAEGQAEVVELLLKNGADPSLKEVDGDTAESFAAKNGHTAVVKILQAAEVKTQTKPTE